MALKFSYAVIACATLVLPAAAGTKAQALAEFVKEVLKQVSIAVVTDVVKDVVSPKKTDSPPTVDASAEDRARTKSIISALVDASVPVAERVALYATRVDYFNSGVVGRDFILSDQQRYENRWPIRKYAVKSIDEIAVAPDRSFVIARYTIDYSVAREIDTRSGTAKVAVLIGSFASQPRIHAIKEWVHRER